MINKKELEEMDKKRDKELKEALKKEAKIKKLNLGCRDEYKKGFINIDYNKEFSPDVVWDLNKTPYPFKDGEINYIYGSHVFEHLKDRFKVLKELLRILKIGGIIHLKVPHVSSAFAHTEQTHVFPLFGWSSFSDLIDGKTIYNFNYKIVSQRYNFLSKEHPTGNELCSWIFNLMPKMFYERFLCWIIPVNEIEVKLRKCNNKIKKSKGYR